jgi:hypothetical protein
VTVRTLSFAFGLLMVAAGAVRSDGAALVAAAVATSAVAVGLVSAVAPTVAVVATAVALVLSGPPPAVAAVAGVAATVYLALRHARADGTSTVLTMPTVLGALGLSAVAVLGAATPLALPWVPLVAPVAVVAVYVVVVAPFVD